MSARGEVEMMIGEGEKAGRGDVEGEKKTEEEKE